MITVITICYCGCVFAAFKIIRIKPTPKSIAVAALIGVTLLGGIVIAWKFSAPMTQQMTLKRYVIQISTDVRERITKVHAEPEQHVKKGDILFEVETRPFQYAVDQATSQWEAAKQTVFQLEAGVEAAKAAVKNSEANARVAQAELDTAEETQKLDAGAIAILKVEETKQARRGAEADDKQTKALLRQTTFELEAARSSVEAIKAELHTAEFNLDQCFYKAPADGYVINWQVREQTMTNRWRFGSVGTFMDMSETVVVAVFPQNVLKNVKPGNAAEVTFKRMPGAIMQGKVLNIVEYTGEGQFAPSGELPEAASVGSKGYLVVRIQLDDAEMAKRLPLGAAGTTTIYTDVGKPFHLISKITIRIKMWSNYAPL